MAGWGEETEDVEDTDEIARRGEADVDGAAAPGRFEIEFAGEVGEGKECWVVVTWAVDVLAEEGPGPMGEGRRWRWEESGVAPSGPMANSAGESTRWEWLGVTGEGVLLLTARGEGTGKLEERKELAGLC